jgi:hypothetical protein
MRISTTEKGKTVCDICGKIVTASHMKQHRGTRRCHWILEAKIIADLETNTRTESLAAALEGSGTIFIPPFSQEAFNWWKRLLAVFPVRYSDQTHGVDFVFFTDRSPNNPTVYAQINDNIVRQIIARQYPSQAPR